MAYRDSENRWVKEYAIAPRYTPVWLRTTPAATGAETSAAPEDPIVEIQIPVIEEDWKPAWSGQSSPEENWRDRLMQESVRKIYKDGSKDNVLEEIALLHNGSPVWWFDLDQGHVQGATLWDLANLKQGVSQNTRLMDPELIRFINRKLWLLSEAQWDNAEYPPPIRGGPPFVQGCTVE